MTICTKVLHRRPGHCGDFMLTTYWLNLQKMCFILICIVIWICKDLHQDIDFVHNAELLEYSWLALKGEPMIHCSEHKIISNAFFLHFQDNECSFLFRYISKEILTIREAVWLTDNTYKYEDLVRMMGEVVSVLEGKIRVSTTAVLLVQVPMNDFNGDFKYWICWNSPQSPTLLDYGEVLLSLLPLERRTTHLFSYICELLLLYSALTAPPPAKLACAALLLTRALHHYGNNTRSIKHTRTTWSVRKGAWYHPFKCKFTFSNKCSLQL